MLSKDDTDIFIWKRHTGVTQNLLMVILYTLLKHTADEQFSPAGFLFNNTLSLLSHAATTFFLVDCGLYKGREHFLFLRIGSCPTD